MEDYQRSAVMKNVIVLFLVTYLFCPACFGFHHMTNGHQAQSGQQTSRLLEFSKIEDMRRVSRIKQQILASLNFTQAPVVPPTLPPLPKNWTKNQDKVDENLDTNYELSDILSYSEAPDNFKDDHIVQFRLDHKQGRQLHVKSAGLLVRVKFPKKNRCKSKNKCVRNLGKVRKKRRKKVVDLVISTVNEKGAPDIAIASVKSHLRKTKWLKLSLPHALVQEAIERNNRTLQVHIKCDGCGPAAELVLVHRRRKRSPSPSKRLNKRRPMLFLHTRVRTGHRHRRSAYVGECSPGDSNCCKSPFVVDFESIGWRHWILSPRRYKTAFCEGTCASSHAQSISSSAHNSTVTTEKNCVPVRWKHLRLVYYSGEGVILHGILPNMIVSKCGCR